MNRTIMSALVQQKPDSRILPFKESLRPGVVFLSCPVRSSLEILGRKWTLLILYSMGFMELNRFNEMSDYMPEITRSVLAKRLAQLEKADYVRRKLQRNGSHSVVWELTEKGNDTIPIIMRLIAHSSKWRADELFEDKLPRNLRQIFPQQSVSAHLEILASFGTGKND